MSGTIKDVTIERLHYDSHDQLRRLLGNFVATTISPDASNGCGAAHLTKSSAKHGPASPSASCRIRTIECPD
jgi:hypothetical protein